ncbi:MerR family transcriptional regulator [Penaeicola halotolerans]|uniref:MerR family transcriptional regulator n=1 Tax=Penaeicola halotolerans TaxID=2793196 RepID=UPI001CF8BFFB|nr:MerR family transcriptional regulator [Penaeicola halotolerans]
MPYKEKEIEKKYYSIGEVATKLGVATSLIRFWESQFTAIKPKKDKKGNRQFTKEDIKKLTFIYHLVKEKGYTLQGAQEVLKNDQGSMDDKSEIINSLKNIRAFLTEIKGQLDTNAG